MKSKRLIVWTISGTLALSLIAAAVVVYRSHQTKNEPKAVFVDKLPASFTVTLTSAGGFSGRGDGPDVIVDQSGAVTTLSGDPRPNLSAEQLSKLRKALNESGILSKKTQQLPDYNDPNAGICSDAFQYHIELKTDEINHELYMEYCGLEGVPQYSQDLLEVIMSLK